MAGVSCGRAARDPLRDVTARAVLGLRHEPRDQLGVAPRLVSAVGVISTVSAVSTVSKVSAVSKVRTVSTVKHREHSKAQ